MSKAGWSCAFAGALVVASLAMWGFTVDDALISIRYAHHLVTGAGYRFNADGPSTDGVTPLPWPFLIAPLAWGSPLGALARVKVAGVVMGAVSAALVGARDSTLLGRSTGLVLLATCLPLAAYCASGMETPLAALLCVLSCSNPWLSGLAAAVRPELLPWAVTLSCATAITSQSRPSRVMSAVLVAAGPFVACALIRRAAFGHFGPLALQAKPSDLEHGVVYAGAAVLASALPVLALGKPGVISGAFFVHVAAVAFAGGDSMPYARLMVPVLPTLVWLHMDRAKESPGWAVWARSAGALTLSLYVVVVAAPRGRHVMPDRAELIERARPLLRGAKRIATVDVGWVSVASDDAHVVDLAGLTDPEIAALPGGHTSKHVSGAMLVDRDVDALVLYDAHAVSDRLVHDPVTRAHYVLTAELPHYAVFKRY